MRRGGVCVLGGRAMAGRYRVGMKDHVGEMVRGKVLRLEVTSGE